MLKTLLKRYFLTGLLVIIPIWGTILILKALFVAVDGILGDLLVRIGAESLCAGVGDSGIDCLGLCDRAVCHQFYGPANCEVVGGIA